MYNLKIVTYSFLFQALFYTKYSEWKCYDYVYTQIK